MNDRSLTALGLVVAAAMLIGGSIVLVQGRRDAWTNANEAADNLRRGLARDIARNLRFIDLSLQGVIRALATPGTDEAPGGMRRQALFDSTTAPEDLVALRVIDSKGEITADSTSSIPKDGDAGDADAFHVHQERRDAGLYISRPYSVRTADGDLSLFLSRRIATPDGGFAGVVDGSLRLAFFDQLSQSLALGPQGTVTLFRDDGQVLYRYPHPNGDIGGTASGGEDFSRFAERDHGSLVSVSPRDGVERLYDFGRISGFPITLAVGRATDDIYAAWWRRFLIAAPFRLILCVGAVASTVLFSREIRRRRSAESALRSAVDELATLARTDGLTGIANRRAFDSGLDEEWRRTIRARASMAVLTIDVDHFKSFNDRYGHPQGDQALRAVATCLRQVARRPADLPARIGGEEFSIMLPETDHAGALGVAEQIRLSVEALSLLHEDSAVGRLTVSIGVAASRPTGGDLCRDLLEAADAALYAAKRAGRNRVCSSQAAPEFRADRTLSQMTT